jgi:putative transferase (TIGR04331 family)
LGPWLLTYVAVIWDRWENIRIAFNSHEFKNTRVVDCNIIDFVPKDYTDASEVFQDQLWNHLIFSDIIQSQYSQQISIESVYYKVDGSVRKENSSSKRSIKWSAAYFIDRLFGEIKTRYKVVFLDSFFDPWVQLKLSLSLRQLPRFHLEFKKALKMPKTSKSKRKLSINFKADTPFEEFVRSSIMLHIPIAYLEGYFYLKNKATQKPPNCDVIFTANAHFYNDLFKVWCAERVAINAKLIVSEHGGAFRSSMSDFNHEEKISFLKTVWHDPYEPNHVKLPPNKIMGIKISRGDAKNIVIIGLESPLFSCRCKSGPGSSLILEDYAQKIIFARKLDSKVYDNLLVRPYANRGWNTHKRYIDDLGANKISTSLTLREVIGHSRIIVCTYPQTTFSEAMHSGVPTILLYTEAYWELISNFDDVVQVLKDASIIFSSPNDAAKHVNKVWEDVSGWWDSEKTVRAREYFFDKCGRVDSSSQSKWIDFFKKNLN